MTWKTQTATYTVEDISASWTEDEVRIHIAPFSVLPQGLVLIFSSLTQKNTEQVVQATALWVGHLDAACSSSPNTDKVNTEPERLKVV